MKANIYTLSQSDVYVFIVRNLGKIFFYSLVLIFIVEFVGQSDFVNINRFIHIVIVFSMSGFVLDRFLRKVACKIAINFDDCIIECYMCRNNEVKKHSFHAIKDVIIKNYITFVFENEKILYHPSEDENYSHRLEKLKALSENLRSPGGPIKK